MVQAMSLFNQLLQHFPSLEFAALVKKHRAERAAKGFSCRTQLVAMLFCQMAHADSLREICNGLACCLGKLVHLGIDVAPSKSPTQLASAEPKPERSSRNTPVASMIQLRGIYEGPAGIIFCGGAHVGIGRAGGRMM